MNSERDWVFGANDPTLIGWSTLTAYLLAAALCYTCGRRARARHDDGSPAQWFWYAAALLLTGLGLNKEMDLQTPLLNVCRWAAESGGWYAQRQIVRGVALAVITISGGAFAIWLIRLGQIPPRVYGPLGFGFFLLLTYVLLRASPIEDITQIHGWDVSHLGSMGFLMELAGIAFIGVTAIRLLIQRP